MGSFPARIRARSLAAARGIAKPLLTPSLPDFFLAVLLLACFGRPLTFQALLADGDTGWHIRTGEYILQHHAVPARDLFSFSRPDQPWFAWEWLSDTLFALCYRWHGLTAVAALAAVVLCLAAAVLLCWLLRRGVGLWVAFAVTLAVVSASSVHYLARPHIFSILLFTATLWILDEDRRVRTGWLWALIPLAALWANLHGGFLAGLFVLGLQALVMAGQRNRAAFGRYGSITLLAAAATLVNPYGWRLHQHIFGYLRSSWILDSVQEFQSPSIRSENMLVFAALLVAGIALASRAIERRHWFAGILALLWALAALRSARHIPLFAIAAAPVVAGECAAAWSRRANGSAARSPGRVLWEAGQDLGRSARLSCWGPVLAAAALWLIAIRAPLSDFPDRRFPVAAVARNLPLLAPPARILTSDQWADYLIFRFYPRQRVFFDGRSDFYGPALGSDYQVLLMAARPWPEVLARYRFDAALLPRDWPLASVLERDAEWQVVDRDSLAEVLVRRGGLKKPDPRTDGKD